MNSIQVILVQYPLSLFEWLSGIGWLGIVLLSDILSSGIVQISKAYQSTPKTKSIDIVPLTKDLQVAQRVVLAII